MSNKNKNSYNEDEKVLNVVTLQSITPKYQGLLSVLITFGVCFVIVIFFMFVLMTPISISGECMKPTLNLEYTEYNGKLDTVYYSKTNKYSAHDIIIIESEKVGEPIIKRVVATGGQTITFSVTGSPQYIPHTTGKQLSKQNLVFTVTEDGKNVELDENYIKQETLIFNYINYLNKSDLEVYDFYVEMDSSLRNTGSFSITLPQNTYFVMGDNRNNSIDSRFYGLFNHDEILGELILHIPHGRSIIYAIWHKIFG